MRTTATFLTVLAMLATGFAASRSTAQEPQSILPALLSEVRGLRAAMEQMASAGPRVQLALGRLQLQEQRLNTLIRRLDTTRESLASAQRELAARQSEFAHLDHQLKAGAIDERAHAEAVLEMKRAVASSAADVQRLTAEEASIANDIVSEQGRWTDINQRLEELERALGRR